MREHTAEGYHLFCILNNKVGDMENEEKKKNRLLVVPVVAFVHYILVLFVFYPAFLLSKSTVTFWQAVGNALHVVHDILSFPRDMLVEFIPSIKVYNRCG